MPKAVSRNLYLLAIVLGIASTVLFFLGFQGSTLSTIQSVYGGDVNAITSVGNPGLVIGGGAALAVASLLSLIAWIGALIRMAQLSRWGWFVCLLVLSFITMLVYIFAGPTAPARQPVYANQYPSQQYPPQQYPRQ